MRAALLLAGWAAGTALAWQGRQMCYACRDGFEWTMSGAACLLALASALWLARALAARLAGVDRAPPRWLRFGWLFALVLFDLLLAFDGRYRDFPLGLFALPCLGWGLLALARAALPAVSLEERFLAWAGPLLGAVIVAQELGLDVVAWLWLGLNLALAVPLLAACRGLAADQPQAAHQHG